MTQTRVPHPLTQRWREFIPTSPYNRALEFTAAGVDGQWCILKVPYREELVGDPSAGVLHGGVITALLDAACGLAVFLRLPELKPMATLDLRLDYLKPATPGRDVLGRAQCYKLTRDLAFVRGCAYHDSPDEPIATAVGVYMFTGGKAPANAVQGEGA